MCPIGRGSIDYAGIRALLTELGYGGYITVEQERDPRNAEDAQWRQGRADLFGRRDERRQDGLRRILEDLKLDAAILTSYHNINYFSDFLYCSFGRRYAFVVTGHQGVSVSGRHRCRPALAPQLRRQHHLYRLAARQLFPCPAAAPPRREAHRHRVRPCQSRLAQGLLEDAFPASSSSMSAPPTMWLRTIKSDEEIALIKEGAAHGRYRRRGGLQCGPRRRSANTRWPSPARRPWCGRSPSTFPHAELMDTWVWFQSGINTDGAHNPVTSRAVQKGDILSLNCFPMIAGYYTALERTLFLRTR
jgi:creatinase